MIVPGASMGSGTMRGVHHSSAWVRSTVGPGFHRPLDDLLRRLSLMMLLLLAGCVTDQPAPERMSAPAASVSIPRGQAGIAISRAEGYYGSAASVDIDANGTRIASLATGATFSGPVRPGPVVLTVSCWCSPGHYSVHFNAEAGKRYAFEVSPRNEQAAATFVGGVIGLAADTAANGENSGAFKIGEIANRN